jgi:predicted membrane protein
VRGDLTIDQPSSSGFHQGSTNYTWDLRFNDNVPLDLNIHFGVGEANLKLGSMSLRSIDMNMGVGEVKMDLRGQPKRSYDVKLHGGVGEATIYLPNNVGIEADAQGGIGGISARGLRKEEGRYINDAYNSAKTKIHLEVKGGVGQINLIAE